ncbi:YfbU family protein [Curtobacterium sp. 458]|uniref:YfbU family protein n=1 Tax=Curtobacterium sp. 458 TaxID=3050069 RepID=UPI0025B3A1B2|nr:YfbU family protein [Curtobacterium sp. 458]WJY00382.1 YfbU family protein [Curtobacterium sp. 458]
MPEISIDDETFAYLEGLAERTGLTVSDLVRFATFPAPASDSILAVDVTPETLTVFQREQLAVQHDLFGYLYLTLPEVDGDRDVLEDTYDQHVQLAEILRNGWTAQYDRVFAKVKPELPVHVCAFVKNTLSMFGDITLALDALPAEDYETLGRHRVATLQFRGFGWRTERRLADYAKHLIVDDQHHAVVRRFAGVVDDDVTGEFPWAGETERAEEYFRMLATFDRLTDGHGVYEDAPLTLSQLTAIADASASPSTS